jgi:hypothetical protein
MPLDITQIAKTVQAVYGDKPHPSLPEVKVKEYPVFRRVAGLMFEEPQPTAKHVAAAYHTLTNAGVSPAEFERVWDVAKPLANHLLDRDPTIHDVQMLTQKPPGEIHSYYMDHPHPEYPASQAGDIARYAAVSREAANRYVGRDPITAELHMFNMGGYTSDEIHDHYASDGSEWSKK